MRADEPARPGNPDLPDETTVDEPADGRGGGSRRRLVGGVGRALDSSLAYTLPGTCVVMAVALGWTYAYLPSLALLGGAVCFAVAAAAGWAGARDPKEGRGTALLALTGLLALAGLGLLVAGVA